MLQQYFYDYTPTKKDGNETYKCEYKLRNISISLANAFRRIMLSEIPIVSFDDNSDNNSITIKTNKSALHNEFIAHRLSLIPICMYKNNSLKIVVNFNKIEGKFIYSFKNPEKIPTFILKEKNETKGSTQTIKEITSEMIVIEHQEKFNNVREFIIPDYKTNDFCIIHRLKPDISSESIDIEEIDITMKLIDNEKILGIGIGKTNARYNPTGTVVFSQEQADEITITTEFEYYKQNLERERNIKGLPVYTNIDEIYKSYKLLDAERVVKRDPISGKPNSFNFSIESIGNLPADQIVYDGLNILKLKLITLLSEINYDKKLNEYNFYNKIKCEDDANFTLIYLENEDHTLGNLISDYMKQLFLDNPKLGNYLEFVSYKIIHPLENTLYFKLKLNDKDYNELFNDFSLPEQYDKKNISMQLFIITISAILSDTTKLINEFKTLVSITHTSYELENDNILENIFNKEKYFN